MTREQQLKKWIEKYDIHSFRIRFESLDEPMDVNIAFLGEFSSGKSSLINGILRKNVLPSMEQPTTGSITEVIPSKEVSEYEYLRRTSNDTLESIDHSTFMDIVYGRQKGTAVLRIPEIPTIQEGFRLVDTPGIASLNETHVDITFGYLPAMDGAVLCIDVQRGGLTQSFLNFLQKPELRAIADRLLFVVTKADQKTSEAADSVRQAIISDLRKGLTGSTWTDSELDSRVLLTGGLGDPQAFANVNLEALEQGFERFFIAGKRDMQAARKCMQINELAEDLLDVLKDHRKNLTLDQSELDAKKVAIDAEQNKLCDARSRERTRLNQLESVLDDAIFSLLLGNIGVFGASDSIDRNRAEIEKMCADLQTILRDRISLHFSDFYIPDFSYMGSSLLNRIRNITRTANIIEMVGTAAIAIALPLTGVVGTAAEIGAGAGVAKAGAAKAILGRVAIGTKTKLLWATTEFIRKVNPVHVVTDFIAAPIRKGAADQELRSMGAAISQSVRNLIEDLFDRQIAGAIDAQLDQLKENLKQVRGENTKRHEQFREQCAELDRDISDLQALISNE